MVADRREAKAKLKAEEADRRGAKLKAEFRVVEADLEAKLKAVEQARLLAEADFECYRKVENGLLFGQYNKVRHLKGELEALKGKYMALQGEVVVPETPPDTRPPFSFFAASPSPASGYLEVPGQAELVVHETPTH